MGEVDIGKVHKGRVCQRATAVARLVVVSGVAWPPVTGARGRWDCRSRKAAFTLVDSMVGVNVKDIAGLDTCRLRAYDFLRVSSSDVLRGAGTFQGSGCQRGRLMVELLQQLRGGAADRGAHEAPAQNCSTWTKKISQ